jgi:hypothetical protein
MGRTRNFDPGSERVIPIGRVDPGGSRERTMASLFANLWWVVFATVCGRPAAWIKSVGGTDYLALSTPSALDFSGTFP